MDTMRLILSLKIVVLNFAHNLKEDPYFEKKNKLRKRKVPNSLSTGAPCVKRQTTASISCYNSS